MSSSMILFILAILIMIYGILGKLIDRKIYMEKIECLQRVFDRVCCTSPIFEDKNTQINFLVKIENDINDTI